MPLYDPADAAAHETLPVINDEDFKYVMQDAGKYYFGARSSYRELVSDENVPFKFRTIIGRYLTRTIEDTTTLEQHLYHMSREDDAFTAYRELKVKVRFVEMTDKRGSTIYKEKVMKINEFVLIPSEEKLSRGIVVRELVLSKLALFAFTV